MNNTVSSIRDSLQQQQDFTGSTAAASCEMCCHWKSQTTMQAAHLIQLQNLLVDRDLSIARLQQDIHQLNNKYVAEIERAADLQHQKDLVEHDLEDLSCKLFEEANGMVATEKRENWRLETKLQTVEQQLGDEQAQLAELRQRLLQWDQDQQQRYWNQQNDTTHYTDPCFVDNEIEWANDNNDEPRNWKKKGSSIHEGVDDNQVHAYHDLTPLQRAQQTTTKLKDRIITPKSSILSRDTAIKQQEQQGQERSVPMSPIPSSLRQRTVKPPALNQAQQKTFQQFVHRASSVHLKKLHQLTYLQICQTEDVEPCLRFGPRSRLSPKKMMEYLLQQSCFIQHLPITQQETTSMIPSSIAAQWPFSWDRWQSSKTDVSGETECAACGQSESTITHQFKMDEKDQWMPMDQYCRDRLVAVCEFFVFIRNIHLRLYAHRTLEDMYRENIRLRLQMFHSRAGTLVDDLESDGKHCPPLDQDDASDGSISSFYPSTPK